MFVYGYVRDSHAYFAWFFLRLKNKIFTTSMGLGQQLNWFKIMPCKVHLLFLSIFLLSAGVSADEAHTCEISFSLFPHKNTEAHWASADWKGLALIAKDAGKERAFINSFNANISNIIKTVGAEKDANVQQIENVTGGYEGITSPSLSLVVRAGAVEQRKRVQLLAAGLGYVFLQDSVLVQCTPLAGDKNLVPAIDLTESGPLDLVNSASVKSIYGMLIGEADGNLNLGFSYYANEDRFSMLGFIDGGAYEQSLMKGLVKRLKYFSQDVQKLTLNTSLKWVSFPSNDWSVNTHGQAYMLPEAIAAYRDALKAEQVRFLDAAKATITTLSGH